MKMYIHSVRGVLDCLPMTKQAIENSIPESEPSAQNEDLQGAPDDGAQDIEALDESSESERSD